MRNTCVSAGEKNVELAFAFATYLRNVMDCLSLEFNLPYVLPPPLIQLLRLVQAARPCRLSGLI